MLVEIGQVCLLVRSVNFRDQRLTTLITQYSRSKVTLSDSRPLDLEAAASLTCCSRKNTTFWQRVDMHQPFTSRQKGEKGTQKEPKRKQRKAIEPRTVNITFRSELSSNLFRGLVWCKRPVVRLISGDTPRKLRSDLEIQINFLRFCLKAD